MIAVLPFPNSDGSCSVLSTYLADELIQSLFGVAGTKLKIIERSQLEALIREVKIGEGGLLNPATTQKLGSLGGVKALALGRVAVIGDHIRINARLISTATGQAVSAAAVSIARNGEIDGLLQQQIGSNNGICGSAAFSRPEGGIDSSASAGTPEGAMLPSVDVATHEGVTFAIQSASRSQDKKTVSIVLALANKLKSPVQAVMVGPKPSLIDNEADLAHASLVNGVQVCQDLDSRYDGDWCARNMARMRWTTLSPGVPTILLMRFGGDEPMCGGHVSLAASILIAPVEDNEQAKPGATNAKLVSLSLANISISGPRSQQ